VAVLPGIAGISQHAYDHPALLSTGFHHAVLIAAAMCVAGGLLSAALIEPRPVHAEPTAEPGPARELDLTAGCMHCPVGAPNARP
jgi:hypothetical protein